MGKWRSEEAIGEKTYGQRWVQTKLCDVTTDRKIWLICLWWKHKNEVHNGGSGCINHQPQLKLHCKWNCHASTLISQSTLKECWGILTINTWPGEKKKGWSNSQRSKRMKAKNTKLSINWPRQSSWKGFSWHCFTGFKCPRKGWNGRMNTLCVWTLLISCLDHTA